MVLPMGCCVEGGGKGGTRRWERIESVGGACRCDSIWSVGLGRVGCVEVECSDAKTIVESFASWRKFLINPRRDRRESELHLSTFKNYLIEKFEDVCFKQ